jgi:Kazal-type serine protease inhibitor-like protein
MRRLLPLSMSLCLCSFATVALGGIAVAAPGKTCLCHIPPGNPDNAHTICVGASAVRAHLRHGDTMGPCPVRCGGDAGDTCGANQFCELEVGVCSEDAEGVCVDLPISCPTTVDPVCGCDGTTYDNECLAHAAGVNVTSEGACEGEGACGGASGATCAETQFCDRLLGVCDEGVEGVCTDKPTTCPETPAPVCGCDGITYDNECLAHAAGVTVATTGACEGGQACGGDAGDTCGDDTFCKGAVGACTTNAEGLCTEFPSQCPVEFSPVCGCDGTTYSNACFADVAGINVAATGACVEGAACGGTGGGTCEEGEFCNPDQGNCAAGAEGACTTIPSVCPGTVAPVCGCNGTTYGNSCLAAMAGVGVDHTGACEGDQVCGGTGGATCDTGEFCNRPVGECAGDAEGICETSPTQCPGILDPVCGCDGTTYSNACIADALGVTVASAGACVEPQSCGGTAGGTCEEGEFCSRLVGECAVDAAGTCASIPVVCPVAVAEVCGCDGTTYDNACFAAAAGVVVNHTGPCP